MRRFMIPIALIAGLGLAPAFAANTPAPATNPAGSTYSTSATQTAAPDKKAACEKSWAAEKHHNGTKAAFLKSCIAKG